MKSDDIRRDQMKRKVLWLIENQHDTLDCIELERKHASYKVTQLYFVGNKVEQAHSGAR